MADYSHAHFEKVSRALGYKSDLGGICTGMTQMWIQAALAKDEKSFFDRLKYIAEHNTNEITYLVEKVKKKKGKNLTEEDRKVIDILALYEGIELFHQPEYYSTIFNKKVWQTDLDVISQYVKSNRLIKEQQLETKTPAEITVAVHPIMGDKDRLLSYFNKLKDVIQSLDQDDVYLDLKSDNHTIGMRYDKKINAWRVFDIEQLSENPDANIIMSENLPSFIQKAFRNDNTTGFNVSLITSYKTSEKLSSKFSKQQIEDQALTEKITTLQADIMPDQNDHVAWRKLANLTTNRNFTHLHLAANTENKPLIHLLIEHGANINAIDSDSKTPIIDYICNPNTTCEDIQYFINNGASVNPIEGSESPLIAAIGANRIDIIELLLDNKCDINLLGSEGISPLAKTLALNNSEIAMMLLESNADVNAHQAGFPTPLMFAVKHNNTVMVATLLDNNADINIMAGKLSAPVIASELGLTDIMAMILKKGITANNLHLSLNAAAIHGHTQIVKMLLNTKLLAYENDIKIDLGPILSAANNGHLDIAKSIINAELITFIQRENKKGNQAKQRSIFNLFDRTPSSSELVQAAQELQMALTEGHSISPKYLSSLNYGDLKQIFDAALSINEFRAILQPTFNQR